MSTTLQEMREDLACALKWAAKLNMHEGALGGALFRLELPFS